MTPKPAPKAENRVRVIGGKWRRSVIAFEPAAGLRPTPSRVRETVFNWLQNQLMGSSCIDLFAGSGACGIEALSRGASEVVFLDSNRLACEAIRNNLKRLGVDSPTVACTDSLRWLENATAENKARFSMAFVDPPYAGQLAIQACELLANSGVLIAGAQVYVELDRAIETEEFPSGWTVVKNKQAGQVQHYLLRAS